MSIAAERSDNNSTTTTTTANNNINNDHHHDYHLIGRSGLNGQEMMSFSIFENGSQLPELGGGVGVGAGRNVMVEEEDRSGDSSSSTSSIGRNSYEEASEGEGEGGDGEEVQSKYKGGALDSLEALEEVLPIKYVQLAFFFSLSILLHIFEVYFSKIFLF